MGSRALSRALAPVATGLLAALALSVHPAHATFPGMNGRIAFQQYGGACAATIHTIGSGGSDEHTFSQCSGAAAWSPNGRKILYNSSTGELYTANADGSSPLHVATGINGEWSPDGSHIVFRQLDSGTGHGAIVTANSDGTDPHTVVAATSDDNSGAPNWSPDGTKIAFQDAHTVVDTTTTNIWVKNANGTGSATQLTSDQEDTLPRWSPDGGKILFVSNDGTNASIWKMDSDGQNPIQIEADSGHNDADGNWSPDGTRIVFASDKSGTYQVYTAHTDGTVPTPVKSTSDGADDGFPDWGPPPVENAPAAAGESYSTGHNTPLNVSAPGVLANDSDPDGDPLTATVVSGPDHGTLTLAGDGSFSYTPAAGFGGSDSFTYRASDGTLSSAPATVTIAVAAGPPPPKSRELGGTILHLGSFEPGKSAADKPIAGARIDVLDAADRHHEARSDAEGHYLITKIGECPMVGVHRAAGGGPPRGTSGHGGSGPRRACEVTVKKPPGEGGSKGGDVLTHTKVSLGDDPSLTTRQFDFGKEPHQLFIVGTARGPAGVSASTTIRVFDGPATEHNEINTVRGLVAGSFGSYRVETAGRFENGALHAAASANPRSRGPDKLTVVLVEAGHLIDSTEVKVPRPGDGEAVEVKAKLHGIFPVPNKELGRVLQGRVVRLASFEPGNNAADTPIAGAKVEVTDASGRRFEDTSDAHGRYLISRIGGCARGEGGHDLVTGSAGTCKLTVSGGHLDAQTTVDLGRDPSVRVRKLRFGAHPNQIYVAGTALGAAGGGTPPDTTIHVFDKAKGPHQTFVLGTGEVPSFPGLDPGGFGGYRIELGEALGPRGRPIPVGLHSAASSQQPDKAELAIVLYVRGRQADFTPLALSGSGHGEAVVLGAKQLKAQ